jgi:hypothetical protein
MSPLTEPVTIPYAERNVADTVEAILGAASKATELRIVLGTIPFWPTQMVSFGASREPARDALARLFAQTARGTLSYRLIFAPKLDRMRTFDYTLNVRPAGMRQP